MRLHMGSLKILESLSTPTSTFPEVFNGLIGGTQKIVQEPEYAHAPLSPKFLMNFCSDELCDRMYQPNSFLPRDASAERGDVTVSRLSVTIRYTCNDLRGWNSSKIISRPNSLRSMRSLTPNMGDLVQRGHPQN